MGRQNAATLTFSAFSAVFSNFDKCRPEVADDVIPSVAGKHVSMDVCVKFGNYRLNSGRIIRLSKSRPFFQTVAQYFVAFCCRPEAASDVMSSSFVGAIIRDKDAKFRDPYLNRSRQIPPEAVGRGSFDDFVRDNFPSKVGSDVLSGVAVESVGTDVLVKLCDSRSNHSRDIRAAQFVNDERRQNRRTQVITQAIRNPRTGGAGKMPMRHFAVNVRKCRIGIAVRFFKFSRNANRK